MASLVLGGIGGFMFGPIGFLAGSLLGNLLFPQKQEGPRLNNLKLQGSEYGKMIPIPYGTIRLAGQVVWQTDLTEHKHTTGGKGGPQVTTYTYTASFAVKICKGPIAGVLTIWANGEIIWDITGGTSVDNTQIPVTFYQGLEGAPPDPTMESILGVGNVPAFQDDAAVVFTDWDLGLYGNTLPQLSFLVFATGGPIPYRVSTFSPTTTGPGIQEWGSPTYDGTTITVRRYSNRTLGAHYAESQYLLDGTPTGTPTNVAIDPPGGAAQAVCGDAGSFGPYAFCIAAEVDGTHSLWYAKQTALVDLGPTFLPISGQPQMVQMGANLYAISGGIGITRWPISGGNIPAANYDKHFTPNYVGYGANDIIMAAGDNGLLYVRYDATGITGTDIVFQELNADLTLSRSWTKNDVPTNWYVNAAPFVVYNGMVCIPNGITGLGAFYTLWRLEPSGTAWEFIGEVSGTGTTSLQGITRFHNGLCLTADGVISLDPPQQAVTLASIVADISSRTGQLSGGDIDVSQLTQLVDGFLITTRADAKTDLDPLRAAYYFDAVEQNGQAVFVNRGSEPFVTIPDNDLAAQAPGDTPPPIVQIERAQEIDLPVSVNVTYIDSGAAWQNGSQQAIRQTVLAQSVADVQLPIAMDAQKGRQIANVNLYETWTERMSFTFQTSRKYLYLEPSDVVSVHGYTMRIDRKTATVGGLVQFEAKASNPGIYIVALTANPTSGAQQPSTSASQPANFYPLDIPLLQDTDSQQAFYAAMAGSVDTTWRGANLYKSSDAGATFAVVANEAVGQTIGTSSNALGNFGGGNTFDEGNSVTVVIGVGGGSLAGATESAVLNGANLALLGNELIQFKNADLTAPSTYVLSGLLRGRRGTEWAIPNHLTGEFFTMDPLQVPILNSELGQARLYKPVTFGSSLAATLQYTFTDNGVILKPYSPCAVGGGPDGSGNVTINWTRRTRVGGAWLDLVDVPLSEPTEAYVVQIWDSTFQNIARVITGLTTPTCVYTAAQQTTDFGATQKHIYCTIGQLGFYGLGTQTSAVIPGAGGSDGSVIAPVPPYASPPPQGGSMCPAGTQNDTVTYSNVLQQVFINPFGLGQTWCVKFTTDTTPGKGSFAVVEYLGPPTNYTAYISTSPCGAALPGSYVAGQGVSVAFWNGPGNPHPTYIVQLAESTDYYINIVNTLVTSASLMNFQGT